VRPQTPHRGGVPIKHLIDTPTLGHQRGQARAREDPHSSTVLSRALEALG
jgi:hypothetical protein